MRVFVRLIVSVVLGLALLIPLGAFYGATNLPVYHSWGLSHGSFTTAIPALLAASFVGLGFIPWFGISRDAVPRLLATASVFVLVTTLFWVTQHFGYSFSVWHLGVYATLFVLFYALCLRAERPWLVPLFLLVPLFMDSLFGLVITGEFTSIELEMFANDLVSKVLPAALASGLAVLVTQFTRRSKA
jgi:hypothetical protein